MQAARTPDDWRSLAGTLRHNEANFRRGCNRRSIGFVRHERRLDRLLPARAVEASNVVDAACCPLLSQRIGAEPVGARAAAQNGSVQFTARITPSGGVDEPVRSFPFYLLRKSYADIQKEAAFVTAARYVKNRIAAFVALPIRSLDTLSLNKKLREIGALEGASKPRPEVA